jgi:hypothetical protein
MARAVVSQPDPFGMMPMDFPERERGDSARQTSEDCG